jgi:hypothetical protein
MERMVLLGNRFHAGTRFGDTRLCHNWEPWSTRSSSPREPWLSGLCLWHAPAVATNAIALFLVRWMLRLYVL